MKKSEESGSPGWSASFFMQTTEDVARSVAAAAADVHSPRPSVVYSSKVESGGQLHRLQKHVSRIIKGLSSPPEVKRGPYNPEILTSQKRQWASFQLQSLVLIRYEYRWADGVTVKKPIEVSAPKYVEYLMDWIEAQLEDESIFPQKIDTVREQL